MNRNIDEFLAARTSARRSGDVGLARAMDAELARLGWREPPVLAEPVFETATPAPLEQAVPVKRKGGRPPKPRCEHGQIVGRCVECEDD